MKQKFVLPILVVVLVLAFAPTIGYAATEHYMKDWNATWAGEGVNGKERYGVPYKRVPPPTWPTWLNEPDQEQKALDVAYAVRWELYLGYPDWSLGLTNTITRAEFATALSRTIGEDPGNGDPWYAPYIAVLGEKGILDPDQGDWQAPITRAEMAAWMGRAATVLKADIVQPEVAFPDVPADYPAAADILAAARAGVIEGYPDGSFRPEATAQRVHAALMLVRLARGLNQDPPDPEALFELVKTADLGREADYKQWDPQKDQLPPLPSVKPYETPRNFLEGQLLMAADYARYGEILWAKTWDYQLLPEPTTYNGEPGLRPMSARELHDTVAVINVRNSGALYRLNGEQAAEYGTSATESFSIAFVKRNGKWVMSNDWSK